MAQPSSPENHHDFQHLIAQEYATIRARHPGLTAQPPSTTPSASGNPAAEFQVSRSALTDEPWVSFTTRDHVGLALSGGGIRSATFNLGLLQALARLGILPHINYLSTVSGGGYVGSFWSAWMQRNPPSADATDAKVFPEPVQTDQIAREKREPAEIRHLREFSRFLMPRLGFWHMETWSAIIAILGGLMPAFVTAIATIALIILSWYFLHAAALYAGPWLGAGVIAVVTFICHWMAEAKWLRSGKSGNTKTTSNLNLAFTFFAALASGILWFMWYVQLRPSDSPDLELFGAPIIWGVTTLVFLICRGFLARYANSTNAKTNCVDSHQITWSNTIDRTISRCLCGAIISLALAVLWFGTEWLKHKFQLTLATSAGATAGTGTTAGALFILLRNWFTKPTEQNRASTIFEKYAGKLKPLVPQLLANAAIICLLVFTTLLIRYFSTTEQLLWLAASALGALVITLAFFNPELLGMHDFYRSRLCRCYLGASRANAQKPERATAEQHGDDLTFADLAKSAHGPVHLVCCAANNLAGDHLPSLYRGARSVTVSQHGLSIGDSYNPVPELRVSSAITASAAAFNSHMGRVSMDLGPAVAFVMSALNLRLGLWVSNPLRLGKLPKYFVGWPFFHELFGHSRAESIAPSRYLHLSDGNHFENLGLYELVRRHCRYIIVSDCGADAEVAFDDLANTLRRIREDFGVEIDLDVTPLRPGENGFSGQHAVLGSIHYDGLNGTDKGSIIYFKPNLTGDEPPDVLQYRTRNYAFPHEGTGDQFYDEAQWESYRRLGEHAVGVVLRAVETHKGHVIDQIFLDVTLRWHIAKTAADDTLFALTERCGELETDLRDNGPALLRAEFFPEITAALAPKPAAQITPPTADDEAKIVFYLLRVAQIMEDVWCAAHLEENWSHPLHAGWMSYLHRWTSTPSFRRWWPILRPFFGAGFRDFARDRFELKFSDPNRPAPPQPVAALSLLAHASVTPLPKGLVSDYLTRVRGSLFDGSTRALEFVLQVDPSAKTFSAIQVALLFYHEITTSRGLEIHWRVEDFIVPPSMNGGGVSARFLEAIIKHFREDMRRIYSLKVTLADTGAKPPPGRADRWERVNTIAFYKSRRFAYQTDCAQILELVFSSSADEKAPAK